jgi:RNA polymerase sigma-70 factor (ECF subfamily)
MDVDWEHIVRLDGPVVWRTACRLLGSREDAEDCVQDAFVAAVQISREQLVQNWRALLQRLVAARAIDRLRRRYRQNKHSVNHDPASLIDPMPLPAEQAQTTELLEDFRLALPALPGEQSQVFYLHCVEGWSYPEIGEALSLSPGAVGMLLMRARAALKERLATHSPR